MHAQNSFSAEAVDPTVVIRQADHPHTRRQWEMKYVMAASYLYSIFLDPDVFSVFFFARSSTHWVISGPSFWLIAYILAWKAWLACIIYRTTTVEILDDSERDSATCQQIWTRASDFFQIWNDRWGGRQWHGLLERIQNFSWLKRGRITIWMYLWLKSSPSEGRKEWC